MVTAILPVYGRPDLTRAAIDGLRRQSRPPEEIVVVDDGSAEPFTGEGGVRVERHERNLGFAAAVNTGLRASVTPVVAILNNDVTLSDNWLELLVPVISEGRADFACGKLYRPDGRIDGTFDLLSRGGLAWRAGAGRTDGLVWSAAQPIAFTSFTAMVARREVFAEVGELDESYHSYYEDVEWGLRAAIHNKQGYFEPAASGVHLGSATAGAGSAYSVRQILCNHRRLAHQYLLPEFSGQYRVARALLRAHFLSHGQWPDVPEEPVAPKPRGERLADILRNSEEQLRQLQEYTGYDHLWKWYFKLAP
jgi:GT2 family glycosyltransferase